MWSAAALLRRFVAEENTMAVISTGVLIFSFALTRPLRAAQPVLSMMRPRSQPQMAWPPAPQQGEIRITYCTKCNWMLRSAWLAQELLSTFGGGTSEPGEVASVALVPDGSGGVFTVHCNGQLIWDRKTETPSFPEAKQLKQRVRDVLCPERSLGHSDVQAINPS